MLKLKTYKIILVGVIFFVFIGYIGYRLSSVFDKKQIVASSTPVKIFHAPIIEGKAAFVLDAKTGQIIYSDNADLVLPLASLTKLMTALVSSQEVSSSTVITLTADDLSQEGDNGLLLGEKWKFDDLRDFTLMESSNDGAEALSNVNPNFIDQMNMEANTLGLHTLSFSNSTGLDINTTTPSNFGSARDISELFKYIIENDPSILEITKYPSYRFVSASGLVHYAVNTDIKVGKIPGLFASKTGYTDLAGGNLVVGIDEDISHPIIIAVLGSSENGRFSDVMALASSTREYFSQ